METMALFVIAASSLCVASVTAWAVARTVGGILSEPTYLQQGSVLKVCSASLFFGLAALAVRNDWLAVVIGAGCLIAGAVAGGAVGRATRDSLDREQWQSGSAGKSL